MHSHPVKGWSLWGRLGERLTVQIFGSAAGFLLKGTQPPLHSRGSGSVNWLKSGNWFRGHNSVFMIPVRLLFTWPTTFLLIQIKWKFSRLPIYFTSRNTMIQLANARIFTTQTILITALILMSIMITTPTLPLVINCYHLASASPWSNNTHCIKVSQLSSHYNFWPTEKNDQGLFKDARCHLIYLTVVVKDVSSRFFQGGWAGLTW